MGVGGGKVFINLGLWIAPLVELSKTALVLIRLGVFLGFSSIYVGWEGLVPNRRAIGQIFDGYRGFVWVEECGRLLPQTMPNHAMELHDWGTRLCYPPIAMERRWMGHPERFW
jgi:hypothetical protein